MSTHDAPFLTNTQTFYSPSQVGVHGAPLLTNANTLFAPEAFLKAGASGIVSMVWAQEPYRLVWCRRTDGKVVIMTYRRDENVVAWQRVETDGLVESLAVIPTANGASDEVWACIKRVIDGLEVRYIERLASSRS